MIESFNFVFLAVTLLLQTLLLEDVSFSHERFKKLAVNENRLLFETECK